MHSHHPFCSLYLACIASKFNPLPMWKGHRVLACEWRRWALAPPVASAQEFVDFFNATFTQGYQDAAAWCNANGYTQLLP